MRVFRSLRVRLVIAIALIGLVAVVAAWLASRQVALEEAGVRSRMAGDESDEMVEVTTAVEEVAMAHGEQDGWTPVAVRAASARLFALVDDVDELVGFELLDDSGRLASSFEDVAPDSPRLRIEIYLGTDAVARLHLHGTEPTPPEDQKVVMLQHDTVDLNTPAPRTGLLVASGVAVLTLLLLAGVVLRLTKPLRALSETVVRFGSGDSGARLEVHGDDEIARLGRAFNDMADALEENETRRRNLVNDVAHELRTPLTNLRFRLESVLDGVADATTEELESMHADTVRLQRLVDDLQMLAVAEAGGLRLQPEPVDLRNLICGLSSDSPVVVEIEVPENTLVMADPVRLEQVLSNLLANAARYAPASAVGVAARTCAWGQVDAESKNALRNHPSGALVESHADASVVVLRVADDGPGIPAEAQPFVFDRFYRVDSSRDRATGGTGLGLAVVRQLIEAMGGRVGLRSEAAGGGAEFVLVLPAIESAPSAGR